MFLIFKKKTRKLIGYDKPLLYFYVVSIVLTLICVGFQYFSIGETLTVIIRLVFYGIVIYVARNNFDFLSVRKLYYSLVFVFSIYLVIQYLYHTIVGGYLPIYLNHAWQFPPESRSASLNTIYRFNFRASSLFLEPSYFTFYALPEVCILMYQKGKTAFDKISFVITVIAIGLSTSSSGIVGVVIIFTCYLFGINYRKTGRQILISFCAILLIIGYFTILKSASTWTVNRLVGGGSVNERIVRGVLVYDKLPLFHKLIGVGLNNLGTYMRTYGISTIYDESNLNYASSVVQTLNYTGIIGLLFLVNYYIHMYKKCRVCSSIKNKPKSFDYESGISSTLLILMIYITYILIISV